jgi:hypothetical protein
MENKKYDVFISYSTHDQKIAEGICGFLERNGYRCFVAYRDILPGVVWARAITEALDDSCMMVVVFSDEFNGSEQTDREIEMASENKMPIVPYRISSANLTGAKKYYLKNINWIDAFPNPENYFGKLLDSVKRLVPKEIKTVNLAIDWPAETAMNKSAGGAKAIVDDLPVWKDPNKKEQWQVTRKDDDGFRLDRVGNKPGVIEIGFREGHYYIQAEYDRFVVFAKSLNRRFGGQQSHGTWWSHLTDGGIYDLKQGEFLKNYCQNERIQQVVAEWIDTLASDIELFAPFANWWNILSERGVVDKYAQTWFFWIYVHEETEYFKYARFVCDYKSKPYGNPFFDVYYKNNQIVFVLWNRDKDNEKCEQLMKELNAPKTLGKVEGNRRIVKTLPIGSTDEEIVRCIEELVKRINH